MFPTPATTPTSTICRRVYVPDEDIFRRVLWGVIAQMGSEGFRDDSNGISESEARDLGTNLYLSLLRDVCEDIPASEGAMEFISSGVADEATNLTIAIPDADWLYVQLVASLFVPGSTPNDLLGLLPADEARSNAHTVIRNTTTASATSGTSSTQTYVDFAATAQNLLASEAEDPPFSQFLWTIHRPRDTDKTVYDGHLYKPDNGTISRFNGKHNFAETVSDLKLSPSAGGLISGSWSLFGVLKSPEG